MQTIDYVYRFDPKNPSAKPVPPDAEVAKRRLEDGNLMFSRWMDSCGKSNLTKGDQPQYVVQCNGLEVGMVRTEGELPRQLPFAVVVGCSDARVPTEMIFGQGFNDLFVIRVVGGVLGGESLGSIGFSLNALSESVRVVVMLGHSGCGAVTAAVDAYLHPLKFWSKSTPPTLRTILQGLFVPVREAANGLKQVWGPDARNQPGYREALIEAGVCMNAAQAAYDVRLEVERAGKFEIEVLYGVYNLFNHKVTMPVDLHHHAGDSGLAYAPSNPRDFSTLAVRLAEMLKGRRDAGQDVRRAEAALDGAAKTLKRRGTSVPPSNGGITGA